MENNIKIDLDLAKEHGLSEEEFKRVLEILGRDPTFAELGIFSVMWSEHCCYKSSKKYLKTFPTKGECVVYGPGENAGVIDIGDGLVLAFKMESHNHPSYIEPYQGAATGVGGILRDVFTMGARPMCFMNALRFGSVNHPKTKYLVSGVVSGIGGYGNSVGVPTIGGDISFNKSYDGNILVNVFCMGVAEKESIFTGTAEGKGNPVIYVGSATGKDGIHGATMASENFDEASEDRRPTVQVGDPFTGKRLIEATLEVMRAGVIVGIQDMGAAGLTCGLFEMSGRGGVGMDVDLNRVPLREPDMRAYDILLSESQERMLLVAKEGCENEVKEIFDKWQLPCETIGRVTDTGNIVINYNGKEVVNLPISPLSDASPEYDRACRKPSYYQEIQKFNLRDIPEPEDYNEAIKKLLSSPLIGDKSGIYTQFDHQVGIQTVVKPSLGAPVMRLMESKKGVSMDVGCNSRFCYIDALIGARYAVAETARKVACRGATPMALTDCLNFASPEREEVMWQIVSAIKGISEASNKLNIPVVSGNVSLYNENEGSAIYPTPMIGVVGVIDDVTGTVTSEFKDTGDMIVLLGENDGRLGGSEYLAHNFGRECGVLPMLDLRTEKNLQRVLVKAIGQGVLKSAHSVGVGGLITTLIKCAAGRKDSPVGFEVTPGRNFRNDIILFSEGGSRALVSLEERNFGKLREICEKFDTESEILGYVGGSRAQVSYFVDIDIEELYRLYKSVKW